MLYPLSYEGVTRSIVDWPPESRLVDGRDVFMKRLQGIAIALLAVLWCGTAQAAPPQPCAVAPGALCGSIEVPLDRSDLALGDISIGFELYPHSDASVPAQGTLVPNPGGPGRAPPAIATTGSRASARCSTATTCC